MKAPALYGAKEESYFATARLDMLAMLAPATGLRLLEVGAGRGATLRAAKAMGIAAYAAGVDLVAPDRAAPGEPEIDDFRCGDVEAEGFLLPAGPFDAVLCADVLEHLVDPWRLVTALATRLRSGGVLLSSIPNARNHRLLRQLVLAGDFRYAEAGLLDRTHLRFFCRRNIHQLFKQAGLVVEAIEENMGGYGRYHRAVDASTCGLFHDFFVFQFRTRARKP